MDKYKVEFIAVDELKAYERNAKKHPAEQVDRIVQSIRQFGFRQNLVIDKDNVVVIGHGRLLAAKKMGLESVPCMRIDDLSPEQIKALRLADNRVSESGYDKDILNLELADITNIGDDFNIDMSAFGFNMDFSDDNVGSNVESEFRDSLTHNVFENQERMQFESNSFYGMPSMTPTQTHGDKLLRFCDYNALSEKELPEYIAHFYYDDFKFIQAWRDPDKYISKLREFKAVISPDFSLYTDFPRALQILSCYRRQWCGAYWQSMGIDVIPDVVWGDEESFAYCFDGIPEGSVVAVSSVGVSSDKEWNGKEGERFRAGYEEMIRRLSPTKIIFYGTILDGLPGEIIRVPSFYEQKRTMLNERRKKKHGNSI